MIVGVIAADDYENLLNTADIYGNQVDIFELRLDYIAQHDIEKLSFCLKNIKKPVIFTVRSISEQGLYQGSEQERLNLIDTLCELKPDYIDIESYVHEQYLKKINNKHSSVKIIRSYHNYQYTPVGQLDKILQDMQHECVDVYKIVGYAKSSLDGLIMANFVKKISINKSNLKVTAHCMGDLGSASRVLGIIAGNYFTYVSLNDSANVIEIESKLGIVNIDAMRNIYNIHRLKPDTKIFALLGSPVSQSQGHIYHNNNFNKNNINAVYIKLDISQNELKSFFDFIRNNSLLDFAGFSVTMPLKQEVIYHIDYNQAVCNLKVINTIKLVDNKLYGINTDGQGALDAVLSIGTVKNIQALCLIGAGATATAIAAQAIKNKIYVFVVCRNFSKAKDIARLFNNDEQHYFNIIQQDVILQEQKGFDVVINTLPFNVEYISIMGIDYTVSEFVHKISNEKTVFMDVNYSKNIVSDNLFCIHGYEMFKRQAELQFDYWLK